MKFLSKLFGGYNNIIPSIAQLILAVFILPILCFILSLITSTDNAFLMISNLLGELSITEYWLDLFMMLVENPADIANFDVYPYAMNYINSAIFETCIIGMSVSLCKNIGIILGIKGIPVIQSIFGIFLGCIMMICSGISNETEILFFCSMLIILNIIVIWLIPTGKFYQKFLATVLGLGLQMIIATLSAGYVIYLILIGQGVITDLKTGIIFLIVILLPMLIMLTIDFFLLTPKKNLLGL